MKFSIRDNNTARKKIRYNRICLKSIKIHNKKKLQITAWITMRKKPKRILKALFHDFCDVYQHEK